MINQNNPILGSPFNALKYFHEHPTSNENNDHTVYNLEHRKAVVVVLRDDSYDSMNNVLNYGLHVLRKNRNKLIASQLHHYRKYGDLFHMYYSNYYSQQVILYDLHSYTVGQAYRCALYQEILYWGSQSEIISASYVIENMHRIVNPTDKLYYQTREWISIGKNESNGHEHIRILPYSYRSNLFL